VNYSDILHKGELIYISMFCLCLREMLLSRLYRSAMHFKQK